jgi:hypothetical protein
VKLAALLVVLALAGVAQAATGAHAQAHAAVLKCQTAVLKFHFVARSKQAEPGVRKLVNAAKAACASKQVKSLAAANTADDALQQASNALVGISDALLNYGHYLDDVAAGKAAGHKRILRFAAEEARQGKLLLTYALDELK